MKGYQKISRDIFGDSGYHLAPYPKKDISNRYSRISLYILVYPKKISHNDMISFTGIQYISLVIQFYPTQISQ
jgi:hypothetical protein